MEKPCKILVTGASGFIGKRLIQQLLQKGHEVYALLRTRGISIVQDKPANLHFIYGDLRNRDVLDALPRDIDVAYYLMHSMSDIASGLSDIERTVAENFVEGIKKTKVQQIIYLGGIVSDTKLSPHLQSRLMVEEILKGSGIAYTILRASIIVGSASASFEIIRDLVEKLPLMVAPRWVKSLCQPIAVRDVLFYLTGVILRPDCMRCIFEIGGPNVLSFKEVLLQYAAIAHLKRFIITVPVLTPRLSSYWLVFITSVRFSLASYLVESMRNNTICRDRSIQKVLPHSCLSFQDAVKVALDEVEAGKVVSTWMDSWEVASPDSDVGSFNQVPTKDIFQDRQTVVLKQPREQVLKNIWSIGGRKGWYALEWAWEIRGLIDKLFGGVGLNRGRRADHEIQAGDSIDFWRVVKADKEAGHLILYAEMKVPGEAWLEFKIEGATLVQTATFQPHGILGRLYWYSMLPFHYFIFGKMAKKIAETAS